MQGAGCSLSFSGDEWSLWDSDCSCSVNGWASIIQVFTGSGMSQGVCREGAPVDCSVGSKVRFEYIVIGDGVNIVLTA